jgi:hypothetical protein
MKGLGVIAVSLSLLLLACSSEDQVKFEIAPYPGQTTGPEQLELLGQTNLLTVSTLPIVDKRERFCSTLGPNLRRIANRNPELSCVSHGDHASHSHNHEVAVDAVIPFVRPFAVKGNRARLISVTCYSVPDPPAGAPPVVSTTPRFARAKYFPAGTELGLDWVRTWRPGAGLLPAPRRSHWGSGRSSAHRSSQEFNGGLSQAVVRGQGQWLLTEFFEELLRQPTRQELRLSATMYREMKKAQPWCPLPRGLE